MADDTVEFAPLAQAEEAGKAVQQASERMANFWMGALSPMWVPFWAATSFGISAWSVTQALSATKVAGSGGNKPLGFINPWMPDSSVMTTMLAETESAIRDTQRAAMKMMMEAEEVATEAVERMPHVDMHPAFVAKNEVAETLKPVPVEAVAAAMDTAADSLEPLVKPAPKKKRAPKADT
ncbi:hypothetical protein Q1W73_00235 [Asticcacaulis sp. ZE23SCel15]|uniref:hypothetical protein n=1 Tax=Asticcacaulis sp. ZE23SCel15 TaxID=3059027 RepID=UPI00265F875A|nr:hypothetical protein [Asticcacaulis sp. ZE23SCel15]WKL57449.1 hypothetical protein Q1W73_00235 [Asticcacaulis sp. ZE23SCel15]